MESSKICKNNDTYVCCRVGTLGLTASCYKQLPRDPAYVNAQLNTFDRYNIKCIFEASSQLESIEKVEILAGRAAAV